MFSVSSSSVFFLLEGRFLGATFFSEGDVLVFLVLLRVGTTCKGGVCPVASNNNLCAFDNLLRPGFLFSGTGVVPRKVASTSNVSDPLALNSPRLTPLIRGEATGAPVVSKEEDWRAAFAFEVLCFSLFGLAF